METAMRPERVFVKGDRRVTTRVPAAAVRFLSEGFREVTDDETQPWDDVPPSLRGFRNQVTTGLQLTVNRTGSPERLLTPGADDSSSA
jgi:hypothetical protein